MPVTGGGSLVVLDGDSFELADGRRVRLPGIDAPEVGRPLAAASTRFAGDFLADRKIELVPTDPGRDAYGRLLADLQADGESLSKALVAAGLAWVYRTTDPVLLEVQRAAVAAGRGVHGRPSSGPWVVTSGRFHHGRCSMVRRRLRELPLAARAGPLFAGARSPCRLCLGWPPVAR